MKLLLDTHILLWALLEPERLNRRVASELRSPVNEIWLSPISAWEILILSEKGKIVLDPDPASWMRTVIARLPFHEARINHEIALCSRSLKLRHQDPVDRFIVATAMVYGLILVTADKRLAACKNITVLRNK